MRNRSSAIAITTNTKTRISSEISIESALNDKDKLEKFTNLMEKELNSSNQFKKKSSICNENVIDIPPPNYLDIKKEYLSRHDKVNLQYQIKLYFIFFLIINNKI
jgi:hypothetical protein